MGITKASALADFGSGIGTDGSILKVDQDNQRIGIGTTNPQATLQVGAAITMYGSTGIISATKFYGDGSSLTNVISGVELQQAGSSVGSAITAINFASGATLTAPSSGLSTITVTGGAVGGASTNSVFYENDQEVKVDYTISTSKNAMSAGPVGIATGITVTIPSGSTWTIV